MTTVATLEELAPGKGKAVKAGGKTIALFRVGDTVYAIDDACPHRGAPLSDGPCSGTEVMCSWHGARFDLTTGAHLCPPARSGVKTYAVQIVGGEVQIDV